VLGKSFTYTYDKGGNIVSKSEYAYTAGTLGAATDTVSYTYDSTWKDKLTSYDGTSITYNEIGNPLTYGGDISYLWDGRELIRYQDANSDNVIHMSYNADGLRTLKNVIDFGSFPWTMDYYSYTWSAGGTLLGYSIKTYPSGRIADVRIIYGENGDAIGFTVKDYEGVEPQTYTYYYIKNAQGDVLRVVDETGATMADYTYDAWGNFTYTADLNAGANAGIIEKYNPVTYRGYYYYYYFYDTDLEMYYLKSRYCWPDLGRFISADSLFMAGDALVGTNMYAYCLNNPVMYVDPSGHDDTYFSSGYCCYYWNIYYCSASEKIYSY
jgi:RHS repeat-associated protein